MTHLLYTNEKKKFVSADREDRAARIYLRIRIDRERTKLSNRKHKHGNRNYRSSNLAWTLFGFVPGRFLPDLATSAQFFKTHLVYIEIEQDEAVHRQTHVNICHVNGAFSKKLASSTLYNGMWNKRPVRTYRLSIQN